MGRWLATIGIVLLLGIDLLLPRTGIGRRGTEAVARADVPAAVAEVGRPLPDFTLYDLDDRAPLRTADLRGHPTLITFERSVDW